jgi:ribosomal protein L11 methyltransferase
VRYVEVTATVGAKDAEAAAAMLRSMADGGAVVETPFTQPDLESDAVAVDGADARVRVYFRGAEAQANGMLVRAALQASGIAAVVESRDVAEEDWAEAWKEHFHVERYGERIVIVPSWLTYKARPGDAVVMLDPGMAFGTGQHETTRLCLETLERAVRPGTRVLDAGCGSGILSLAAARLGATEVVAVDIDRQAAAIATDNARRNGIDGIVRAAAGSLGDGWPFAEPAAGRFDVVVANIIASVIVRLAPDLTGALAPGGRLIVSGVIEEREAEVVNALEAAGARIAGIRAMADWRCIEAVRG